MNHFSSIPFIGRFGWEIGGLSPLQRRFYAISMSITYRGPSPGPYAAQITYDELSCLSINIDTLCSF